MALVKYNNNSISAVTSASSIPSGALTHIKTLTASSSATLSFVDGSSDVVLDSTYPIYKFTGINIHTSSDGSILTVGFRDGGTDYDAVKTSTSFRTYHDEGDTATALAYVSSQDLAQSTSYQPIIIDMGTDNDQSGCFEMYLYNPSSTTFVKHFISTMQNYHNADYSNQLYVAGYCNTTTAIDGVQFKMNTGNIDAGTIKLYGIKDS